jgi:peptide deformylase
MTAPKAPIPSTPSSSLAGVDPAALRIVEYPAPVLRARANPMPVVNDNVRAVAHRMIELMRKAEGIGLAAPQVGLSWRMFVVDVPPRSADKESDETRSASDTPPTATAGPQFYINPVLSKPTGSPIKMEEGCLSLPDIRGDVLRPPTITIAATDLNGKLFTQTATGLLARCWQHEMDHLDGVLIIDKMTQMSRLKNRNLIKDLENP